MGKLQNDKQRAKKTDKKLKRRRNIGPNDTNVDLLVKKIKTEGVIPPEDDIKPEVDPLECTSWLNSERREEDNSDLNVRNQDLPSNLTGTSTGSSETTEEGNQTTNEKTCCSCGTARIVISSIDRLELKFTEQIRNLEDKLNYLISKVEGRKANESSATGAGTEAGVKQRCSTKKVNQGNSPHDSRGDVRNSKTTDVPCQTEMTGDNVKTLEENKNRLLAQRNAELESELKALRSKSVVGQEETLGNDDNSLVHNSTHHRNVEMDNALEKLHRKVSTDDETLTNGKKYPNEGCGNEGPVFEDCRIDGERSRMMMTLNKNKQDDSVVTDNDTGRTTFLFYSVSQMNSKEFYEEFVRKGYSWDFVNSTGETILHRASMHGNLVALEYFTSLGADINARDENGLTPLLCFSSKVQNCLECLEAFKRNGADIHAKDKYGNNFAFLRTLGGGSRDELEQIVKLGVKWNEKNEKGEGILHVAAEKGNVDAINYFGSLGASVNARDGEGRSPLLDSVWAEHNFIECFKLLKNKWADIHAVDKNGHNIVHYATLARRSQSELEYLVGHKIKWNTVDKYGDTVLHLGAQAGNVDAIDYFSSLWKDNLDQRNNHGLTPLHCVPHVKENFIECLAAFKRNGANINAKDTDGNNVAFLRIMGPGSRQEMEQIVKLGVEWSGRNERRESILHLASRKVKTECLEYFLSLGAPVNAVDVDGRTPLHLLAYAPQNFMECLTVLMHYGADMNSKDKDGNNLVFLSTYQGRSCQDLEHLVKLGIPWNTRNTRDESILHYASRIKNVEAIKYFASLGAPVNIKNRFGRTPLHYSSLNFWKATATVTALVSLGADINAVSDEGETLLDILLQKNAPEELIKTVKRLGGARKQLV